MPSSAYPLGHVEGDQIPQQAPGPAARSAATESASAGERLLGKAARHPRGYSLCPSQLAQRAEAACRSQSGMSAGAEQAHRGQEIVLGAVTVASARYRRPIPRWQRASRGRISSSPAARSPPGNGAQPCRCRGARAAASPSTYSAAAHPALAHRSAARARPAGRWSMPRRRDRTVGRLRRVERARPRAAPGAASPRPPSAAACTSATPSSIRPARRWTPPGSG